MPQPQQRKPYGKDNPEPGLYGAEQFGWQDLGQGLSDLWQGFGQTVAPYIPGFDTAGASPDFTKIDEQIRRNALNNERLRAVFSQPLATAPSIRDALPHGNIPMQPEPGFTPRVPMPGMPTGNLSGPPELKPEIITGDELFGPSQAPTPAQPAQRGRGVTADQLFGPGKPPVLSTPGPTRSFPAPGAQPQTRPFDWQSYTQGLRQLESSGQASTAPNKDTGAFGVYQLLPSTYDALRRQYPNLPPRTSSGVDEHSQEQAYQLLTSQNQQTLKNLGVEATPSNTYLAHKYGPEAAAALINAGPGASVSDVLRTVYDEKRWKQAVAANRLEGRTVGQEMGKLRQAFGEPPLPEDVPALDQDMTFQAPWMTGNTTVQAPSPYGAHPQQWDLGQQLWDLVPSMDSVQPYINKAGSGLESLAQLIQDALYGSDQASAANAPTKKPK